MKTTVITSTVLVDKGDIASMEQIEQRLSCIGTTNMVAFDTSVDKKTCVFNTIIKLPE